MPEAPDPRATSERIERLLADLGAHADPRVTERAEQVVRLLMELYGAALERIMEAAAEEPSPGPKVADRLAGDELVASLLIVHGLHPVSTAERVRRALDSVRPYLGSHAGGVQLLGVSGDVVRLRLEGNCDGCPSSTVTISSAIERAIAEAAPEITAVEVEGATDPSKAAPGVIPVESLYRGRAGAGDGVRSGRAASTPPRAQPGARAGDTGGTWTALPDVSDLAQGELRAVEIAGRQVLLCRCDGNLYAYRDLCPACGSAMAGGELDGEVAGCPSCRRGYNVRLAGRSAADREVHLDPLPLITRDGETRICVPVAVAS